MKNVCMGKKFCILFLLFLIEGFIFSVDVVEKANGDYLNLEETIALAEEDGDESLLKKLRLVHEISLNPDEEKLGEILSLINSCPYMPCLEAERFMLLSSEEVLNEANYIYSVFTGCPTENEMKDKVYLRILEASMEENNYLWSYNAARDLSEEAKKTETYKVFSSKVAGPHF